MARIVACWELGAGYGHVAELIKLALRLRRMGHSPVFVVRQAFLVAPLLRRHGFEFLPAPVMPLCPDGTTTSTYAQLMLLNGYGDEQALGVAMQAWGSLFKLLDPKLVLCNHAPTAALAARALAIPTALSGTGFTVPPDLFGVASFADKNEALAARDAAHLRDRLAAACRAIGLSAQLLDGDPFDACLRVLHTFPELDAYPGRAVDSVGYVGGGMNAGEGGLQPVWPQHGRPKIFAYLSGKAVAINRFLTAAAAVDADFVAYLRVEETGARPLRESPNVTRLSGVVDISSALQEADMVVSHGSHGTLSSSLLAGTPLVMAPNHPEQVCHAYKAAAIGAGRVVMPAESPMVFRQAMEQVLADIDNHRNAAQAFARRYPPAWRDERLDQAAAALDVATK